MAVVGWQELPGKFEVSLDAATARVQRRFEYVLRHLEWRIMEMDRLRARLDERQAELDTLRQQLNTRLDIQRQQLDILRQQVERQNREIDTWRNAYEATMATKTMRFARMPRALYARVRGRT